MLKIQWTGKLTEYITAVSWSKKGDLAVSSADGEVMLFTDTPHLILPPNDTQSSIDYLAFSADSQFLAVGGQNGQILIWQLPDLKLVDTLNWNLQWLENLAWHPQKNYLAFSQGRYVQIWDVETQEIITSLPFENSTVLDFAWHPQGEYLAIAGDGGVKIWDSKDWLEDPIHIETYAPAFKIKWAGYKDYLAISCLDDTVMLWDDFDLLPWRLSGFSGKVRNLTWSRIIPENAPLLGTSSRGNVLVWQKEKIIQKGWSATILNIDDRIIQDLQFNPHNLLLAGGNEEGCLFLWENEEQLMDNFTGIEGGFSCLQWDFAGEKLAVGSDMGEVFIFQLN
ncbi:WD40 repeat domain-containing protein [Geminocystis sp.]|uniref:WD40 repeat domain-containing protein n=1 Tax=Geminocystis sp. TaxID=2664100 RepID=UPI00359370D4